MLEESNEARTNSATDVEDINETGSKHVSFAAFMRHLRKRYGRRPMNMATRYFQSMFDIATYANNTIFLMRCQDMTVVPKVYRLECRDIKNTREVIRILNECSYRLMLADLDYNRLKKVEATRFLEGLHEELEKILSEEDLHDVMQMSVAKYEEIFDATRDKQQKTFQELLEEYEMDKKEDDGDHQE